MTKLGFVIIRNKFVLIRRHMSNNRIDKVNELIQQQLAEYFSRELEFSRDTLVTITRVEITKDLQFATVWLSILPINHSGSVLEVARKNQKDAYQYLKKKLFIKRVPKLNFRVDDTEEKAAVVEGIIDDLNKDN